MFIVLRCLLIKQRKMEQSLPIPTPPSATLNIETSYHSNLEGHDIGGSFVSLQTSTHSPQGADPDAEPLFEQTNSAVSTAGAPTSMITVLSTVFLCIFLLLFINPLLAHMHGVLGCKSNRSYCNGRFEEATS